MNVTSAAQRASASGFQGDGQATTLHHDFGLVRPKDRKRCHFTIHNPTDSTWTFGHFHHSCVCTVSQTSARAIQPGQSKVVEVDYAAPGENKDDRHRVGVRFKEAGAPFVWLEITAQVREPLTVTPPEVIFGQAGKSRSLEKTFEIQNFTEVDCHLLSVRANSPWLAVRQAEFAAASNKGGQPRQVWRILVKAQTRELAFGKNHAQIEIETDHPEVPHRSVPVTLDVASPVAVVPSQLFFGDIEASPPSSHKVLLRFSPDAIPARAEDILVSHDLGDRLSLACVRTTQNCYWELVATLTPSRGGPEDKVIQGTVAVSFANQELPTLRVPVYARMR